MANLALNGVVHGAALNGKVLFDNSANWQDLGDLQTSSKDMSWASNSRIAGSHMVAKHRIAVDEQLPVFDAQFGILDSAIT